MRTYLASEIGASYGGRKIENNIEQEVSILFVDIIL